MLQGLSVSPGVAVGRAVIFRFGRLPAFRRAVAPEEFEREERRLRRAAARAAEDLARHSGEAKGDMGSELAAILEAHSLIAADETYLGAILERMRRDRVNAEWALAEVTREFGERLAAADSAAMREREADVADVAREIAAHLSGGERPATAELRRGSILVADELSPVEAARLDPRRVRALALERGGPTSHASIIARSFGLPAVVGIADLCESVSPERPIVVDGDRGLVDPSPSRQRIRRSRWRVGAMSTTPRSPSTMIGPSGETAPHSSGIPTTAGSPNDRAMIEACEVGPPRSSARARTRRGSRRAASTGDSSSATRIDPRGSSPGPGRRPPERWAAISRATSAMSASRSRIAAESAAASRSPRSRVTSASAHSALTRSRRIRSAIAPR